MQHPIAMALLVATVPIILALCRAIGPGRAAIYAILGVFLIHPRYDPDEKLFGIFMFDKLTVAGLSLTLGVLLFDRRTLAKLRLHWVDGPILLYIAAPLMGLILGKTGEVAGSFDQAWMTFAQRGVPYFLGRIYYGDPAGARRLAIAVVASATLYIPFCFYEMLVKPEWHLRPLLFGIAPGSQYRLGGLRPSVMMTNGLELAAWMALSTVLATWLWASRERWQMRYLPAWLPPVALLVTALGCRSVYSYLTLALGLSAIGLLLLTRSRWVLGPLLLIPVGYIGLRVSGIWDARNLIDLANQFGGREASSVGLRLGMEDQFIRETSEHDLMFGLGGRYALSWADGWWLMILKRGGLVGLAGHYGSFLFPAALFLCRRSTRPITESVAAGLALFLILQMIDSLHNTSLIAVSTLLGGSLVGIFLGKSIGTKASSEEPRRASTANAGHATYRVGDIKTKSVSRPAEVGGLVCFVLSTACLLYVFGHANVVGQEGAKFVGGLGSALLFGAVGAVVAGSARRSLARTAAFGLAFAALGITFNLSLHASSRPVWSADILQGMALSGLIVAAWRRVTGGGSWSYAALVLLASTWWVFEPFARAFPGSQYLFETGSGGLSLFPILPWLTLTALGAWLCEISTAGRVSIALTLGALAALGWNLGPLKFPLNPIYAMTGGSLASAVFAVANLTQSSFRVRAASDWLGRRWLIFFYLHLGIAPVMALVLERLGLTQPIVGWSSLAFLSIVATWFVSWVMAKLRQPFRQPATWAILMTATLAVGFLPELSKFAVLILAGGLGLLFASRYDDLSVLILGPMLDDLPRASHEGRTPDFAKVALVIGFLIAPEAISKLPEPFGLVVRKGSMSPVVGGGASASETPTVRPIGQPGNL